MTWWGFSVPCPNDGLLLWMVCQCKSSCHVSGQLGTLHQDAFLWTLPLSCKIGTQISCAHVELIYQLPNGFEILHRAWQWYCRALCKIAKWLDSWNGGYGRMRFCEIKMNFEGYQSYIAQYPLRTRGGYQGSVWTLKWLPEFSSLCALLFRVRDIWFGFDVICAFTIVMGIFVLLRVQELVIVVLRKCFCVSILFCHQIKSWFHTWTDSLAVV